MQHLRRIKPAVEIVKSRHRIGRVDILLHKARRQNRCMKKHKRQRCQCGNSHIEKTDTRTSHIRNIYFCFDRCQDFWILPVLRGSCLSAEGLPRFAFAVLLVEILQELCSLFGSHLAHLHRLFLRFIALAVV